MMKVITAGVVIDCFVIATLAGAQSVPMRRLTTPTFELAQPLMTVTGVRELSDGRLIVVDARRNAVLVADPEKATVATIGSVGEEPGHYCHPTRVLSLPGDTTLVYDAARARLVRFVPTAQPKATLTPRVSDPIGQAALVRRLGAGAVDVAGRFYSTGEESRVTPDFKTIVFDSVAIERWIPDEERADTVGFIPPASQPGIQSALSAPRAKPFLSRDQWAVAGDGRVAVAYLQPYHVDIINPDGTRTTSGSLPHERLPVTEAERRLWLRDRPFLGDGGFAPNVRLAGRIVPGKCGELAPNLGATTNIQWPDSLPTFPMEAVSFAPDGLLWVQRSVKAGQPRSFDVFDWRAHIVARVAFPPDTRLVGFGRNTVYAVRIDDNRAEFLQGYALPRLRETP